MKFTETDSTSNRGNPNTNSLALASIPAGVLLPPVGIALGHLARKRIKATGEQGIQYTVIGLTLGYITLLGGLFYGVVALKDADTIGSALYYVLLGIVAFVAIVVVGIALARYVPIARGPLVWWLNWLAEKTQKTKTRAEVEKGFWGKLVNVVMKRPIAFAAPIAHRDDRAHHPAGTVGSRWYQRKVPSADQFGPRSAGGFRQDLPHVPHRAADAGHCTRQTVSR